MSKHELKVWPEFYEDVASGVKPFEARRDDRGFRAGDTLRLREWSNAGGYTGRECVREVTYVLSGEPWGLLPGYVVLGLNNPAAEARGFVRARERAEAIAERCRKEREILSTNEFAAARGPVGQAALLGKMSEAERIRDAIRTMQDEGAGEGQG